MKISGLSPPCTARTADTPFSSLAKISSDQAKAAVEKSASGSASSVKLEEENGNVVYAATVGTKEVKVDAGNGKVLHTEAAYTEGSELGEGIESE